ncbi:nucleotide pyrophosphohydrolase [Planomicrobium sp. YIM 101495]|uniref:nucleotide pyrophosphohydrolase n=1 Tax=Planomicrobium sp. YIM 101495 TaxID=2665160 RepID=UPI0012B9E8E3|nr:nucleotide pyrophosphohydrolase [Planomicrobium sp. YIM 101495]MTD30047.1 nucleotide pyrophosphohydrolase [Planomicrobium sp. YIM 101495]
MSGQKTIKQIQGEVDAYIGQFKEGYFTPMELVARLTEELGELSREVMHEFGPKKKKEDEQDNSIGAELGDLLFVMTCLANSLDIDLQEEHDKVLQKFNSRDKDRWTRKEDAK